MSFSMAQTQQMHMAYRRSNDSDKILTDVGTDVPQEVFPYVLLR